MFWNEFKMIDLDFQSQKISRSSKNKNESKVSEAELVLGEEEN